MSLLSRLLLTIVTLTSCVTMSFAQGQAPIGKDLTVTVKVADKTGAMPGASVLVKGTTNGQITGPTVLPHSPMYLRTRHWSYLS